VNEIANKRISLRKKMVRKREMLTADQVEELSLKICLKLIELEPIRKAHTIMGFSRIKNEVNLNQLLEEKKKEGKIILLPRIEGDGIIKAVEFDTWENTRRGQFSIAEPTGDPYDIQAIDVVLVPGLVFDGNGYRLGYGKGYYDRFLIHLRPGTFIVGVCYEFQVVEDTFPYENDIPVHWIVTDKSELGIDWKFF